MNCEISITETEWKIMEILWDTPMLTIGSIKSALSDSGWSDSTIKTLVRRLSTKGALGIDEEQSQFRYYPCVSREKCRLQETKKLINRIYHGSVKLLMANLVSDSSLSDSEAQELLRLIDKMVDEK